MSEAAVLHDTYLRDIARAEQESLPSLPAWLAALRRKAAADFERLGFPGPKDEEWRQTPVSAIAKAPFAAAAPSVPGDVAAAALAASPFASLGLPGIVFVNGRFREDLSSIPAGVGLFVGPLARALSERAADVESRYGRIALPARGVFAALNTALAADAAIVLVGAGARVDQPIHVIHLAVTGAEREAVYPRTLVAALPGSRATVIETHLGADGRPYLAGAVTEIDVHENASLEHCRVEADGDAAFHVAAVHARLGRDARLVSNAASLGAGLARIDVGATLAEGSDCTLNGIYLAGGARHVDHHTAVDHAAPHGTSHQLYKGILSGAARAVFNGRIRVAEGASKTDAFQANRNLLLSRDALVFTRPQLEIHADDVKCTHGATVGRLDASALFYLRSRGIGEAEARRLLVEAFLGEAIGRIGHGPLADRLTERARAMSAQAPAEGGPP